MARLPRNGTNGGDATPDADRDRGPLDRRDFDAQLVAAFPGAYRYALRLTRNSADAEDLVQEAALLACRGVHTFEAGSTFKPWFFRILVRCFYNRHRVAKRRPETVELDDASDIFLYSQSVARDMPSSGDDPARQLLDRLGTERVVEAIAALPEEYAVACTLYFMEDFAYHEIAQVLDVPIGTVRSRLHRGRKMLQKALWQLAEEAGVVGTIHATEEERP